ncbi:hypothetical protein, partial [Acidovorax kalamii]|uniref:hypothetical protein n=1 Tax=Acidovorax kalamii TaxID=2004485 RepID=UPI0020901443
PMVFREKPPSRELTVPVLETIRTELFRVYPSLTVRRGQKAGFSHPYPMETLMPIWNGGIGGFPARKALSQQVIVRAQAV